MIGDFVLRPDFYSDPSRDAILLLTKVASFGGLSLKNLLQSVLYRSNPSDVRVQLRYLTQEGLLAVERTGLDRVPDQPFVRLTPAGWAFALDTLLRQAAGQSWERLAQLSITATHRQAAVPTQDQQRHHRDATQLLLECDGHPEQDFFMPFAASWQPAFPSDIRGVSLPEPAYVGVVNLDGHEVLIFGECDNTSQSPGAFRQKMERYAQLARRPDFVEQVFGYRDFHVWVTVADPAQRAPMVRMRELINISRQEGTSRVTSFTLLHWALADNTAPIWFMDGQMPRSNSQDLGDHLNTHRYDDIHSNLNHVMNEEALRWHRRWSTLAPIPPGR
jgi:hypothetical protein